MTLLKTYLLTHNVDSISQDDSSVSLPIKLKVIKTFIIICIIYFIIINFSLISTIPPNYISRFGFFPALFSYHTWRQGVR